jgi:hypothetical protein
MGRRFSVSGKRQMANLFDQTVLHLSMKRTKIVILCGVKGMYQ